MRTGGVRGQVGQKTHPMISQIWRRNWQRIIPFFAFATEIRKDPKFADRTGALVASGGAEPLNVQEQMSKMLELIETVSAARPA